MPSCPECKKETNGRKYCTNCGKPQVRFEDINPDGADRDLFNETSAPACCFSYLTFSTGLPPPLRVVIDECCSANNSEAEEH
jgi:hypothetical protein